MKITMTLRPVLLAVAVTALSVALPTAQSSSSKGGVSSIQSAALKEWLTYIASDELQGREVYTEGLGLAASYIAEHLKEWGVKPGVDGSDYFQTIKVVGVRTTSKSSVTVAVNGESRTFHDGDGITLPRKMGGRQTVISNDVRFVGYGLQLPSAGIDDYAGADPKRKVIVWLGPSGPRNAGSDAARLLVTRSRAAIERGAVAVIGPLLFGRGRGRGRGQAQPADPDARPGNDPAADPRGTDPAAGGQAGPATPSGRGQAAGGRGAQAAADFTTAERYDVPVAPAITAQDEFFEFLFSGSEIKYNELKDLASRQQPLPRFALKGVTLTITVEPEYSVAATRLSRNVVGVIEGSDPKLKDTYVAFGAHYDHIGYQQTAPSGRVGGVNPGGCVGQTRPQPRPDDVVNNGADDDGSGTVALLAIARAFALGPRPKRSLVFVWHTAEESGLQGSRYNADFPVVPNEKIVAQLNVDMIGRNRCDQPGEANSVYLVGADRISTDLHNVSEDANESLSKPMKLDYELNDPADPQSLYTRSDHYSYAAKGIPVIFYTTGLHRDYHYLTDEIDKIEWDKLTHVTQLVYTTGQRLANLDRAPVRDNKGPRAGKGSVGKIK
jgi:hypothetical protein